MVIPGRNSLAVNNSKGERIPELFRSSLFHERQQSAACSAPASRWQVQAFGRSHQQLCDDLLDIIQGFAKQQTYDMAEVCRVYLYVEALIVNECDT